ncbi:MAG: malonyl-CoA synthase [Methylobacteriaceae bacterium]|nr:malonyl-CoA synthase [Methylobacteriaceae bacterium]
MSENLFELIRARIPAASKTVIETEDGVITYGDLVALSGRAANALRACGVGVGDRVAVQLDKSPEMLIVYLACLRAGAVFLPLNTGYTLAEIEYFVSDAGPSLVLCRPATLEAMRALGARLGVGAVESLGTQRDGTFWPKVEAAAPDFADAPRAASDLAAILYTSGTTGRSKGAMLSHRNLASNSLTLVDVWRFTAADVLIHALPIYHTHGLFVATNVTLFAGASMIFQPKFDPDAILRVMPRATAMMGVPTFYTRLLEHPGLTRAATKHMRLFVSGSAPLLAETHEQWRARTGHAILERYGMTETNMNTSNPYDGDRVAGTVGFPLPDVALRIADPESGRILPQGEIGVIEVRGPNVFSGYWRMPEKTASEFRPDGFFITGDLGRIDERGYVHIVGRAKDLIISGGFNVYPKEVESEIDALPGVVESAVFGVAHPDFGEGVTAVVVTVKGAALEEKQVIAALENRLAKFKLPKRVFIVDDLPRNAMGKVQKNLLRETHKHLYARV